MVGRENSSAKNEGKLMTSATRREILKMAGALMASSVAPGLSGQSAGSKKKVIVAGAGIGGLCCAYELVRRGHEVTVLEAAGRTGGHVLTVRDNLADGLYVDAGAEHFTKPGYDLYWQYVKEFDLPVLSYPRRPNVNRFIDGRMYTPEMLADRNVLNRFGFSQKEINYLANHQWWEFELLYFGPYLDSFKDEYRPFEAKLDHLDQMSVTDLVRKDGASGAAIRFIGGSGSALQALWHAAILKLRGVPIWPPQVFRIRGGNQTMTDAFAARLGERVRLGCPVTAIEHGGSGVTVHYREFAKPKKMEADYLVSCVSLVQLRKIPVTPDWPEDKGFVIRNTQYYSISRPIFQSRTRFWEKDGISPSLNFREPALEAVWRMADDIPTHRGLLVGSAAGNADPEESLATFRRYYPGRSEDIEQVRIVSWPLDPWASACERIPFPGQLARFWPKVMESHGRIHFAGAYADNLDWGMEAATRSANRVAVIIDRA
jgi:monoamine oxidase